MKKIVLFLFIITISFVGYHTLPKWISSPSAENKSNLFADTHTNLELSTKKETKYSSKYKANEPVYYDPAKKEWKLVWQDEFDSTQLHRSKWVKEDWAAEKNNELQYYRPENVLVEDGYLKLISKKENFGGRAYTSGAIHSKNKFSFQYGKIEMRAKLPKGQGIFPAFWMLVDKDKIYLPEIDIMEMLGHKPNETWMVEHWSNDEGKLTSTSTSFVGPDYSADFHTFGVEWTKYQVIWFIDGVERFRTDRFVPHENMYIYLNTAIGGNWPGSPDATTSFPQIYEVDYVRVYEKVEGGN
jgi:beta-glucanase (GH16 family)